MPRPKRGNLKVLEAFAWYEERRSGLGVEFRDALDATIARALLELETL